MATFQFQGTVINDGLIEFTQPANTRYRENSPHIVVIGMAFTQGEPKRNYFAITETSDHISDVGIRYSDTGAFESSVLLTPAQAVDLSPLEMQFTTAEVTSDEAFSIAIESLFEGEAGHPNT